LKAKRLCRFQQKAEKEAIINVPNKLEIVPIRISSNHIFVAVTIFSLFSVSFIT